MDHEEQSQDVLTLTEAAADVIFSLLREQGFDPATAGLRVSIERGGCAGLTYRFDLQAAAESEDFVSDTDQVHIFIDEESIQYVRGAKLDVDHTAHGTGFSIDNPNAAQECGCGISFSATD